MSGRSFFTLLQLSSYLLPYQKMERTEAAIAFSLLSSATISDLNSRLITTK